MQKSNAYKSLQVLFIALLTGQIIFLLLAFFLVKQKIFIGEMHHLENIMMPVLIILSLVCMVSGNRIFKKKMATITGINSLSARFNEYRTVSLARWALLEGCCLFSIICFMLTSNYQFILIAGLLLFIFGSVAPLKNKVAADMGITTQELDAIS